MRRLVYLVLLFLLVSCSREGRLQKTVEDYVSENQMVGEGLRPDVQSFEVVRTVTVQDLVSLWYVQNNVDNLPADSAKADVEHIAAEYELYAREEASETAQNEAKLWRAKVNKIHYLEAKDPDDTEYYLVKTTYKLPNPAIFNQYLTFFGAFVVSADMNVWATMDEEMFQAMEQGDRFTVLMNYDSFIDASLQGLL